MKTTITLNAYSRPRLQKQLEKLYAKCNVLGVTHPIVNFTADYKKNVSTGIVTLESFPHTETKSYPVFDTTLEYEPIKLADWMPIAALNFNDLSWKQFDIDAKYEFDFASAVKTRICQHCGNKRVIKTFILKKEDTYKQVGKDCLKDFTGVSPEKYFSLFKTFNSFGSGEEFDCHTTHSRPESNNGVKSIDDILVAAKHVIEMDNGVYIKSLYQEEEYDRYGRSQSHEPRMRKNAGESTGDKVKQILDVRTRIAFYNTFPERVQENTLALIEQDKKFKYYTEQLTNVEFCAAVRAWLDTKNGENDFQQKLKGFTTRINAHDFEVGFVCYIASAYMEYVIKNNRVLTSDHFFTEGEKVELNLTKIDSHSFNGQYGTTYIETYITDDNRMFKYMGGTPIDIEKNEKAVVKATIKHSEYNGRKETRLQRLKVIHVAIQK